MQVTPFISIVVPTWCRKHLLCNVISSIAKQASYDSSCELIICDSNSPDGTEEEVKKIIDKKCIKNCYYINSKSNTPSAKRNLGIFASRGEWIVLLDDDCIVKNDYLVVLIEEIAKLSTKKTILCGEIRYPTEWVNNSNYFKYRDSRHFGGSNRVDVEKNGVDFKTITTMNMAVHRKSILNDQILFDEEYLFHCEDTDFGWRLEKAGYVFKMCNAGIIHHETSKGLRDYLSKLSRASKEGFPVLRQKFPEAAERTLWRHFECHPGVAGYLKYNLLKVLFGSFIVNIILSFLEKNDSNRAYYFPILYKYVLLGAYFDKSNNVN